MTELALQYWPIYREDANLSTAHVAEIELLHAFLAPQTGLITRHGGWAVFWYCTKLEKVRPLVAAPIAELAQFADRPGFDFASLCMAGSWPKSWRTLRRIQGAEAYNRMRRGAEFVDKWEGLPAPVHNTQLCAKILGDAPSGHVWSIALADVVEDDVVTRIRLPGGLRSTEVFAALPVPPERDAGFRRMWALDPQPLPSLTLGRLKVTLYNHTCVATRKKGRGSKNELTA